MGDTGSHYGIDNLNVLVRSSNLKLESRSGVAPSCADHGLSAVSSSTQQAKAWETIYKNSEPRADGD